MKKNYYEIFDEFEKLKNKDDRIRFLRAHDTITLRKIIAAAFNPRIKFHITKVPAKYKPSVLRAGMNDFTLDHVMNKIYLFEVGNPRTPNITEGKREMLLIQFLEGMEPREADLLLSIIFKTLDVKYLTAALVKEVWPGLIPIELNVAAKKE